MRTAVLWMMMAAPAMAAGAGAAGDPRGLLPGPPALAAAVGAPVACGGAAAAPFSVGELVELALCRNPATAAAWAAVRTAAADSGQARAALLPDVSAGIGPGFNATRNFGSGQFGGINPVTGVPIGGGGTQTLGSVTAQLSVQYLLFDFGGRRARIEAADAARAAALAAFADTAQATVAQVAQGYNGVLANEAAVGATDATVRFAESSVAAARGRERAGVGLRSDTLQAETALAQARLARRQAEGQAAVARGQLAVAAGLPPQSALPLEAPGALSAPALADGADALIAAAERARPDLARARALVAVADAQARAARAALAPSVGVGVTPQLNLNDQGRNSAGVGVGVTLNVPLFNGFGRTYAARAAEGEAERQAALAEQARQQAGLDVWTEYQNLRTSVATLEQARAAGASAAEAARLAQGRFRAGVGTLPDLLNAQDALAQARLQLVNAEFGVRSGVVGLARAVGDVSAVGDGR